MPVLMSYGYAQDDLETLIGDCVNLVSSRRIRVRLMKSCRVLDLRSISVCLLFTRLRSGNRLTGRIGRGN
jgi:hypothetical protein